MKVCPFCQNNDLCVRRHHGIYWGACDECGTMGPEAKSEAEAITAWDTRPREEALEADLSSISERVLEIMASRGITAKVER